MQIEYCGRIYDEETDFVALLRAAARNEYVPGLRNDLDYWAGLGALHEALLGTPPGQRLAEAALTLMETGTPDEFCLVQGLEYDMEPGIPGRMLAFIDHHADRIPRKTRGIGSFLMHLVEALPTHPAAIAFLRRECDRPDANNEALWLSARFDIDWFLQHLRDFLGAENAHDAIVCLYTVPVDQRPQFLETVLVSGQNNVDATVRLHLDSWSDAEPNHITEAMLLRSPAFAEALIRMRQPGR